MPYGRRQSGPRSLVTLFLYSRDWAWAFLELLGPHAESVDELQLLIGKHWPLESLIREAKAYSKYPYARSGGEQLPPACVQLLKDAMANTTLPAQADDCGCELEPDDDEQETHMDTQQ